MRCLRFGAGFDSSSTHVTRDHNGCGVGSCYCGRPASPPLPPRVSPIHPVFCFQIDLIPSSHNIFVFIFETCLKNFEKSICEAHCPSSMSVINFLNIILTPLPLPGSEESHNLGGWTGRCCREPPSGVELKTRW